MSQTVKLTAIVTGESVLELSKLRKIKVLAEQEIHNNEQILKNHRNVEFRTTEPTIEVSESQLAEMVDDGYYSEKIQDIIVRKSGDEVVLFLRREKD